MGFPIYVLRLSFPPATLGLWMNEMYTLAELGKTRPHLGPALSDELVFVLSMSYKLQCSQK